MDNTLHTLFSRQGIFSQLGVTQISVFGSYARGEKYADIDLLPDTDPGYEKREMLKAVVESSFHIPCDVVVKDKLEPIILYDVNKDLVYVKDR